ncbi:hypothetical protein LTR06_011229 [Exophiala xenobiotica]|nr:hypothetical protein LTR06_011229 [Exophiala xenobiotica]
MAALLTPVVLGNSLKLSNRVCMGSMTRNRCIDDGKPTQSSAIYYAQRAETGLIVAEGTFVSLHGSEWPFAPVMFTEDHAMAWKEVVDAVHQADGKIYFQPWHPGRIQNEDMPLLKQSGYPVLAPSPVPAKGGKFRTLEGQPGHTKNIMEIKNPKEIVEQFRTSVKLAKQASFDGIELLSQGGYLLHNFLCSHANLRLDEYGGSVENRCRFPLEVLDAIIEVWGSRLVGIKICPTDDYNDSATSYQEAQETYTYYIKQLMLRNLGYINLSRRGCDVGREQDDYFKAYPRPEGKELPEKYEPLQEFGGMIKFPGSTTLLMVNHEYTVDEADTLVKTGKIDLISFGRPFIYNPDLIDRTEKSIAFAANTRGKKVNYGPFHHPSEDYTDWPTATAVAT